MKNLDKFTKVELLDMLDRREISLSQYLNYKNKLCNKNEALGKKKCVLKSQVDKIYRKPREREVNIRGFWSATGLGIAGGAVAGALIAGSDASSLNQVLAGVAGGVVGGNTVMISGILYGGKVISNKINDARIAHKNKKINKITAQKEAIQKKFYDLQNEESKRQHEDLYMEF